MRERVCDANFNICSFDFVFLWKTALYIFKNLYSQENQPTMYHKLNTLPPPPCSEMFNMQKLETARDEDQGLS